MGLKQHLLLLSCLILAHCVGPSHQSFASWLSGTFNSVSGSVTAVTGVSESTLSRDVRRISFLLYPSKDDLTFNETLSCWDIDGLKKSGYNRSLPLLILTHGFMPETKNKMVDTIKKAYRDGKYHVNIIATDWSALSRANRATRIAQSVYYSEAAQNVPKVGKRLADFLICLKRHKMIRGGQDVHLVGFSLGAHVSGMAGYYYRQSTGETIKRITGLDPAGPNFINQKNDDRLDKTDADFVDVIHTNRGIFGLDAELGHIDFYPNGGGPFQVGCPTSDRLIGICSHSHAYLYWAYGLRRSITACRCNPNVDNLKDCMRYCKDPLAYGQRCPPTARGQYYFKIDLKDEIKRKE